MSSISINIFSGRKTTVASLPVPILSRRDYDLRLSSFIRNVQSTKRKNCNRSLLLEKHKVVCHEPFKINNNEAFFFPTGRNNVKLNASLTERFYFLRDHIRYGLVIVFEPVKGSFLSNMKCETVSQFDKCDGYPEGASTASVFSFSSSCISCLASEHGLILTNSDGSFTLQGISVSLLQNESTQKCVLLQKSDIIVSPISKLIAADQSASMKVRLDCSCRQKGFVCSIFVDVLSPYELEKKFAERRASISNGLYSNRTTCTSRSLSELLNQEKSCLIVFPPGMELDILFSNILGGNMYFSYVDESLSCLNMVFLPNLVKKGAPRERKHHIYGKNWGVKETSAIFCSGLKSSCFSFSNASLVMRSPSEYHIAGIKMELVSSNQGGMWGVLCSTVPSTKTAATASVPPERQSQQRHQGGRNSPVPGPSGVRHHPYTSRGVRPKSSSTVSVPPERQSQDRQEGGRSSPVPGPSGVRKHSYRYSGAIVSTLPVPTQAAYIVSFPPERQSQDRQEGGRISPVPGPSGVRKHSYRYSVGRVCILPFRHQASSTVSVPPERQSQHREEGERNSPVPEPSGVRHHSYGSYGGIVSPLPLPTQASSTVSVPPERQSQQREQEDRGSPVTGPSSIRHHPYRSSVGIVRPVPLRPQEPSTAFVPPERQSQHRHQESPVPGPSGVISSSYIPYWTPPFSGGPYPYGSPFSPFYQQLYEMQGQWVPSCPPLSSLIRPPMPLETPSNDAPVGSRVSVGNVEQRPIWRPYEEATQSAQEENSGEESEIDVVN